MGRPEPTPSSPAARRSTPDGTFAVGRGAGGPPEVSIVSSADGSVVDGFVAFDPLFDGGVFVG